VKAEHVLLAKTITTDKGKKFTVFFSPVNLQKGASHIRFIIRHKEKIPVPEKQLGFKHLFPVNACVCLHIFFFPGLKFYHFLFFPSESGIVLAAENVP